MLADTDVGTQAAVFYDVYAGVVIVGAVLVEVVHDLVALNVVVEVMNTLMLPLALGLLVLLARRALPPEHHIAGA